MSVPQPLVSIALCTYNGGRFLKEQLDSIIGQTYKNLEIVIVDDCSTDNTATILKDYAEKDTRIKLYDNEVNLGFNKNFERALNLTSGELIAISDQDDIWIDTKIADLAAGIGDNLLIFSNSSYISEAGTPIKGKLLFNFSLKKRTYHSILLGNFVTGHTTLFRREFLEYVLPFPEVGFYDWWMGFVALYYNRLGYLDKVLTKYRIHEESVIRQSLQIDDDQLNSLHTKIIKNMLASVLNYKNLKQTDRAFVEKVARYYRQVDYPFYNISLIIMIMRHFYTFFPDQKKRTPLSKFNYVLKYARRVKETD